MMSGLKNARSIYQICMLHCFSYQLTRNLDIYVDAIVIKFKKSDDLITDLEETFTNLQKF